AGILARIGERRILDLIAGLEREEILALRDEQIGAVEREERLALLDELARVVDKQISNPSIELDVHVRPARLVVANDAGGPHRAGHRLAHRGSEPHADQLLP